MSLCDRCDCKGCAKRTEKRRLRYIKKAKRRGIKPGVYVISAYQGYKAQYMCKPWLVPAVSKWKVRETCLVVPGPHGMDVELKFMKDWATVVPRP